MPGQTRAFEKEAPMPAFREKTLNRISALCRIVFIVLILTTLVAALAFFVGVILFMCGTFGYDFFVATGAWDPTEPGYTQCDLVTEGATFALFGGLAVTSYIIAAKMFHAITKTRRPFERARARELKGAAWVNAACAILPAILAVAVSTAGFGTLYVPEDFGIDYDTLINAFILLAFAYIFDYGCILQEQDDELL